MCDQGPAASRTCGSLHLRRGGDPCGRSLLRRRGSGGLADPAGDAGMDRAGVHPGLEPGCVPGFGPPAPGGACRCFGRGQETAVGVLGPVDPRDP